MEIKKSSWNKGWIGFFDKDENGHPEEFLSVKSIKQAQRVIDRLQKSLNSLKQKEVN